MLYQLQNAHVKNGHSKLTEKYIFCNSYIGIITKFEI